jgi:hypothetical protein
VTDLRLVTDNDPPHDTEAEWRDGIAFKRLSHLIAQGLAGYMKRGPEHAHMMPSEYSALHLARECPGVLDAIRGPR